MLPWLPNRKDPCVDESREAGQKRSSCWACCDDSGAAWVRWTAGPPRFLELVDDDHMDDWPALESCDVLESEGNSLYEQAALADRRDDLKTGRRQTKSCVWHGQGARPKGIWGEGRQNQCYPLSTWAYAMPWTVLALPLFGEGGILFFCTNFGLREVRSWGRFLISMEKVCLLGWSPMATMTPEQDPPVFSFFLFALTRYSS